MNNDLKTYSEYDRKHIFNEQQATFESVFSKVDLSKIAFVGGVADYLNLRDYYDMPVNDLDIIFQDEEDLRQIIDNEGVERFDCKFYKYNSKEVLVSEFFVDGKRVHIDYYQRNFSAVRLTQSYLLGYRVMHASFKEMKKFHNDQIGRLTSSAMGKDYDWKRLYKHSKKASLYNNVDYLSEKKLLHTIKNTVNEAGAKDNF